MADIDIQKKSTSVWPWILGLIVLALAIWALAELFGGEEEVAEVPAAVAPAAVGEQAPLAMDQPARIPVAAIAAAPANYRTQPMEGLATVVEVPTDRAFWVEDGGQRMLAIIDEPKPEIMNVNAGQTVRIRDARVFDTSNMSEIPGNLDPDTKKLLQNQQSVLYVKAQNLEIVERPTTG